MTVTNRQARNSVELQRLARSINWKAAQDHLKQRGWECILHASCDGETEEFGSMYVRDGKEFWLNVGTVRNLPE